MKSLLLAITFSVLAIGSAQAQESFDLDTCLDSLAAAGIGQMARYQCGTDRPTKAQLDCTLSLSEKSGHGRQRPDLAYNACLRISTKAFQECVLTRVAYGLRADWAVPSCEDNHSEYIN